MLQAPSLTKKYGEQTALNAISQLTREKFYFRLCQKLSGRNKQFIFIAFVTADKGRRNMEIYVIDVKRFASVINQHQSFYGQFSITPLTPAEQAVTIIEYEQKYDRWRGYGYLFGYPNHAVDFFVQAGKSQDSTNEIVKRDFFHVPGFSDSIGYFTYAVPKNYSPTGVDSTIYDKAVERLKWYKKHT